MFYGKFADEGDNLVSNSSIYIMLRETLACCTVYNNVLKICFSVRSITVDVHLI
jgi:hypothetical protein